MRKILHKRNRRFIFAALSLAVVSLSGFSAPKESSFTPTAVNSPTDQYFINYAHPTGSTSGTSEFGKRGIKTLTFSDDLGHSLTLENLGTGSHKIYVNRSSKTFYTKAGATISTKGVPYNTYTDMWTCSYLYIDFNNDHRFDVDQSIEDANNDLVVHNGYNTAYNSNKKDTSDPLYTSTTASGSKESYYMSHSYDLPSFKLPEDMAPGYYIVRYKNDWNSTHPYGRTNNTLFGNQAQNNGIEIINGVIVDFTICIITDDSEIPEPTPEPDPEPEPEPDPDPDPIQSGLNDPDDPYFVDYAHVEGYVDGDGGGVYNFNHRGLDSLIIADNYDNQLVFEDFGKKYHEVYVDMTDEIFTTKVGSIIKIKGIPYPAGYAGNWTCSYFYIDFDNDKRFDVDQSIEDANHDLVVYNGYGLTHTIISGTSGLLDTEPDSSFVKLDGTRDWYDGWCGDTYSLPEFQLPKNMTPGRYRVRYKNDWNSTHPFGRTNETLYGKQCIDNGIIRIGGIIIDFTLRVKPNDELLALDEIEADTTLTIDYSLPYEVYNLQGIRVGDSTNGLAAGFYVVRQGAAVAKIAVK